jgi:hypothetical protein
LPIANNMPQRAETIAKRNVFLILTTPNLGAQECHIKPLIYVNTNQELHPGAGLRREWTLRGRSARGGMPGHR